YIVPKARSKLGEEAEHCCLQLPPFQLQCARNSKWDIQVRHQYPQTPLNRQVLRKRWHDRAEENDWVVSKQRVFDPVLRTTKVMAASTSSSKSMLLHSI